MKIAPALPNPQPSTAPRGHSAVAAVHAPNATGDAADGRERRSPVVQAADATETGLASTRGEILATRQVAPPPRVAYALASYVEVAGDGRQRSLREMLGFDAYA